MFACFGGRRLSFPRQRTASRNISSSAPLMVGSTMDTVLDSMVGEPSLSSDRWSDRVNILGVGVSAITIPRALGQFDRWITAGAKQYVCVADVHAIMQSRWSEQF